MDAQSGLNRDVVKICFLVTIALISLGLHMAEALSSDNGQPNSHNRCIVMTVDVRRQKYLMVNGVTLTRSSHSGQCKPYLVP